MHAPGHVGIGLLLYVPLGHALAVATDPAVVLIGLVTATITAVLPDIDVHLPIAHRGPTHSMVFVGLLAVLASGSLGVASQVVGGDSILVGSVVAIATMVGAGSHLVADGVTPMGIRPFWPLSERHYTLAVVASKHRRLNASLLICGLVAGATLLVHLGD